jgi:hypothetical protein
VDSVTPIEALRAKVAETCEAFERAASASYLHDDPAKDQFLAMGLVMESMLQICEVNDASHRNAVVTLEAKIDDIAGKATDRIVEKAGPHVADVIEKATLFQLKTIRPRTLLSGAVAVLIGGTLIAGFSCVAGFSSGQTQSIMSANVIASAMTAGPKAASAWSLLMANNDPIQALAVCQKSATVASDGRHYCSMLVWLDRKFKPS